MSVVQPASEIPIVRVDETGQAEIVVHRRSIYVDEAGTAHLRLTPAALKILLMTTTEALLRLVRG